MSKSVLYAGNNLAQTTTATGSIVSFPNIVRRYGCDLDITNGNAIIKNCGYYNANVNLTIVGTVAGTETIAIYLDGVAIPFAQASVVTSADSIDSITIPCVIRKTCGCTTSTITVVASGVVASITNASIDIEKE